MKVKLEKHVENLRRLRRDDNDVDTMMYYLVERFDDTKGRVIGYISVRAFDDSFQYVKNGETYRPDDPDYRFTSKTDNLVCEPADLCLSYRDD